MADAPIVSEATQAAKIASEIQQIVMKGEVQPGEGLNEQKLADRFGVSRTPIREALRLLTAAGVVEQEPRKRARVARLSVGQVIENLEALAEIEASCARLAVRRMTPVERANLAETHDEFCTALKKKKQDLVSLGKINLRFHEQLVDGCHNASLINLAKSTAARVIYYRAKQAFQAGRLERSAAEHEDVLKAVQKGDEERVYKLMRSHFEIVSGNVTDLISAFKNMTE